MSKVDLNAIKSKCFRPWYAALGCLFYDPSSSADSSCAPVKVNTTFLTREEMPWIRTWQQSIKTLFTV